MITLDASFLTSYYQARLGLANAGSAGTALGAAAGGGAQTANDKDIPPWDASRPAESDSAKLRQALAATSFIQTTGRYYDDPSVPDDHKKLFALYQALTSLQALAAKAADKNTQPGELAGLDKRFQAGLDEITQYLSATTLDGVTLLRGDKRSFATSTLAIARSTISEYRTGVVVNGAYDSPIPGVTGNEVFTVTVKKNGTTQSVDIDLSQLDGPPTLDNVVKLANDRLAAAGIVSRLKREKIDEGKFGLSIQGVETETLTLSAPAAQPAVYLAGVSGTNGDTAAQVIKLSGAAGNAPAIAFSQRQESETGPIAAKSSALDSQGNLYVVGTAQGDIAGKSVKGSQDLYLSKYDSTGKLMWSRLLGASDSAEGFAVAVDGKDNVVVAGRVTGDLTAGAIGGGADSFVTKFNSDGEEQFTRQIAPLKDDSATSLAIGADGAIYVGGWTKGAVGGQAYGGGTDGTVQKLDEKGKLLYSREFGGAGNEATQSVALASDGNLLVASVEDGHAIVRKYDSADGSSGPLWSIDLGDLQGGKLGNLAVDGNSIYLVGATGNGALDAGGTAAILAPANGASDGFLTRIADAGASASADYTRYIGTGSTDSLSSVTVKGGKVYVAGQTSGALPGQTKIGDVNGFAAQLDAAGNIDWTYQYGGRDGFASAASIQVDPAGSSVLDKLGLPNGTLNYNGSNLIAASGALREGDTFQIAVNGGAPRTIRIAANETMRSLSLKIAGVLLLKGKATVLRSSDGDKLNIQASEGTTIEFIAGPAGKDALQGLGIAPGKILDEGDVAAQDDTSDEPSADTNIVGLGLDAKIDLRTLDDAKKAVSEIETAMLDVRKAYRTLTLDPLLKKLNGNQPQITGTAPAYLTAQLANYQAGLARLQAGGSDVTALF